VARPKEHKPETILLAALSVFHEEGVTVSTARIAKAAGVSNGSLFNYFPTKQALIDALYVSIKSEMAAAVGEPDHAKPIEHRVRQIWDRWFEWARDNREAHHVMNLLHQAGLASADAQAVGNQHFEGSVAVFDEALAAGVLVDLPIDYLGALVQQQIDQAVVSELDDHQAEVAFGVLWNGITRNSNPPSTKASQ